MIRKRNNKYQFFWQGNSKKNRTYNKRGSQIDKEFGEGGIGNAATIMGAALLPVSSGKKFSCL